MSRRSGWAAETAGKHMVTGLPVVRMKNGHRNHGAVARPHEGTRE